MSGKKTWFYPHCDFNLTQYNENVDFLLINKKEIKKATLLFTTMPKSFWSLISILKLVWASWNSFKSLISLRRAIWKRFLEKTEIWFYKTFDPIGFSVLKIDEENHYSKQKEGSFMPTNSS